MKITTEFIDHISQLSRLRLPEEEKAKMAGTWRASWPIWTP